MIIGDDELYRSQEFTTRHAFTAGIEGPACDRAGNVYAVNYARQGTIGIVAPDGSGSVFVELPGTSVGNGIRFSGDGSTMYIADYVNHNILAVEMATRAISVYAHAPAFNQPNDLAIGDDGTLFASDPCWADDSGQIWRIGRDQQVILLEGAMGTTNGIEVAPDQHTLYVNETVQRRILAYDLAADGVVSNKRVFHQFADFLLDGMRCDRAGNLYVTRYGKGTVVVFSPAGLLLREIALHGRDCTNVAFGGSDGRTCFVTVADTGAIECFRTAIAGREP